jgi:KDO2-lipid IV(A) lauroyltransferase
MSRPRSRLADYAVFLALRFGLCLVQALPINLARSLARGLGWLAFHLDKRHRWVACENVRQSFPGRYTEDEITELVRGVYRHFCQLVVEIAMLPRKLHANTWRRYLGLPQGRLLVGHLLSGRPLLIVTGHFGNWELAGYALGLLGFQAHAVARPIDNPYLDDFLRRFRERTGQKLLAKRGDFERMNQILAAGGVMATLADQDAGSRGLFVNFFGRPASTHKAIALLALEHRVPMVVTGTRRVREPMQYEIIAQDAILPEDYLDRPDATRAVTQRFTTALEEIVCTAPEQYFWLHRRWKHQPAVKKIAA